jgi:hypothetical protein
LERLALHLLINFDAAKVRRKRQSAVTQIASKLSHFAENSVYMPTSGILTVF